MAELQHLVKTCRWPPQHMEEIQREIEHNGCPVTYHRERILHALENRGYSAEQRQWILRKCTMRYNDEHAEKAKKLLRDFRIPSVGTELLVNTDFNVAMPAFERLGVVRVWPDSVYATIVNGNDPDASVVYLQFLGWKDSQLMQVDIDWPRLQECCRNRDYVRLIVDHFETDTSVKCITCKKRVSVDIMQFCRHCMRRTCAHCWKHEACPNCTRIF